LRVLVAEDQVVPAGRIAERARDAGLAAGVVNDSSAALTRASSKDRGQRHRPTPLTSSHPTAWFLHQPVKRQPEGA
jgi:hypothetical protein